MLTSLTSQVRIFFCLQAADMRQSFEGLRTLVAQHLGQNPLSGDLFVFRNVRGDRLKILYWNGDGFAIWYKLLEKGTFRFPQQPSANGAVEIDAATLAMILAGIDLSSVRRQKRFKILSSSTTSGAGSDRIAASS